MEHLVRLIRESRWREIRHGDRNISPPAVLIIESPIKDVMDGSN
jgi:hypothetical protein